jgi:hypothetical protein
MNTFTLAAFLWLQLSPFNPTAVHCPTNKTSTTINPLTAFTAEVTGEHTELKWTVAENETISGFEIVKTDAKASLVTLKKVTATKRIGFEVYRITLHGDPKNDTGIFIRVIQKERAITSEETNEQDTK